VVRHLAAVTVLARCGEEHLTHWQLIFQETEVALGYRVLFRYKRPDNLTSNTAPNVNQKTALTPLILSNPVSSIKLAISSELLTFGNIDVFVSYSRLKLSPKTPFSYGHPIVEHLRRLIYSYLVTTMRDKITLQRQRTYLSKMWQSSNILRQYCQTKSYG